MIEGNIVKNQQKQIQPQIQQTDNEVFESVSQSSGRDEQQDNKVQQDYTLTPIAFPFPESNTLRLLGIYQQNTQLINNLKAQISRLSKIKKENLFIKHDCVKMNFQQQESEFFLRSQELYKERQQELLQIKRQIKAIDRQQLTTLMSGNLNTLNISKTYFSKFRTIISAKIYQQELILLTEEKKKAHQKKKKRNEQDEIPDKLSKSQSRSRSAIKNSQQKIDNIQNPKRNEQQRSDNDSNNNSRISTPRKRDQQKFNSYKRIFNIRFVHLSHLFSQLQQKSNQRAQNCFTIGTKTDTVPRSIAYDSQKKLVFVLFSTNVIYAYGMWSESQQQIKEQHSVSHKSHRFGHNKLKQVPEFKIEIDLNVQVVFFQLSDSTIYIATSDGILRVYQIQFDLITTKKITSIIKNVIYCLNCDQSLGQISFMSLGDQKSDEIFFVTDKKKLCKLNLNKYKTEIVKRFDQKVLSMGQDFIETESYIYLYYKQGIYQYFSKEKNEVFEGYDEKESLNKCSLIKDDKIFFIKVDKHGLLKGFSEQI